MLEFIKVLSESTTSCERLYMCGLSERFTYMNAFTGGYTINDGNLELRLPSPYPDGGPWVVKDVKISAVGEVFGSPPLVYLTVSYGIPKAGDKQEDEEQEPIDLYSVSASVSAEALKIPSKRLKYSGESEAMKDEDDAGVFIYIPSIELGVSSDKCKGMNLSAAKSLVGKVNNSIFRVRDGGGLVSWSPECVLYMGESASTTYTSEGFDVASQDHKFLARDRSWNQHFDAETGSWREITTESGQPLYTPADLMALFR